MQEVMRIDEILTTLWKQWYRNQNKGDLRDEKKTFPDIIDWGQCTTAWN